MNTTATTMLFSAAISLMAVSSPASAQQPTIELFDAIDRQLVAVRYIAVSPERGNIVAENLTGQRIAIVLPDALAARPVMGQFANNAGALGAGGPGAGGAGAGGAQPVGGNANGGGGVGAGNNQGLRNGGVLRIGPRRTARRVVTTVCLEHGRPDPRAAMNYELVPIDQITDDPVIVELCRRLGGPDIDVAAAQAAAWHRRNAMSWQSLAKMNRLESKYLGNIARFHPSEIAAAKDWIETNRFAPTSEPDHTHQVNRSANEMPNPHDRHIHLVSGSASNR